MTTTDNLKPKKLIHVARTYIHGKWQYLFLRENEERHFVWHEEHENEEKETSISAESIEEAMRLAAREWKNHSFSSLLCGFRYTLPERDEHGINAFFYQMAASYSSSNGVYYDETLGNNCFVQNASEQALGLWRKLKNENRLG